MFKIAQYKIAFILFALDMAIFANPNFDNFDQFIENAKDTWNSPGVSVSVVKGEHTIFQKSYGVLRFDKPEKVDEKTIFQLASVSKTFTAAALGLEVQKGTLKWDDHVIMHLPYFILKDAYATRYATSKDLLAHRTGLPAFGGDLLGKIGYSDEEILTRTRYIEPAVTFREIPLYSNVGFFIAGMLVQGLTQHSFEDVVEAGLLAPLDMRRSGFSANLDQNNVAYGHALIDGKMEVVAWDRTGGFPAAGAVTSTAEDMTHWMIMHLNQGNYNGKSILKPEIIEEMFQPAMVSLPAFSEAPPINKDAGYAFGLGWDSYYYNGHMIVEKAGGLDGMRSIVTLIPDLKMGITVLSNMNLTLLPEAIRAEFLEHTLGKASTNLQNEILAMKKDLAGIVKPEKTPADAAPMGHQLENYAGTYASDLYGTGEVYTKEGKLYFKIGPNQFTATLSPFGNDSFQTTWPIINTGHEIVTFLFGPNNKPTGMQTETLGKFTAVF